MRDHALKTLQDFVPKMGLHYASGRNYDKGAGRHTSVSCLSSYIRRRLITEEEVVAQALANHGLEGAEKFIQEVFWRSYFKGWLERRPSVWHSYRSGLRSDHETVQTDRALRRRLTQAEAGETGIACFDAWVDELLDTGYLHNHARMWFASIWIFTLSLPWRLGADFFHRHLLDGDPAANTLSWRWVAGLHTRGRAYQAKAWNIAKYTNLRFDIGDADLADPIAPLDYSEPDGLPRIQRIRDVVTPKPDVPTALLISEEDCSLDDFALSDLNLVGAATISASHLRSDLPVADHVTQFEREALGDTVSRLSLQADHLTATDSNELARWATEAGAKQIATAYIPQGPLHDWFEAAAPALNAKGIALCEWRRPWDEAIWPHATAGFFKVKKQIPKVLESLELY
jgi:deoxyribodipyrimidine photo-lyase